MSKYFRKHYLFLLLLLILPTIAFTQVTNNTSITLTTKNAKVIPVFRMIEKQTNYRFVYDKTMEKSRTTLTLEFKNIPLQDALKELETVTLMRFKISGKIITVTDGQQTLKK